MKKIALIVSDTQPSVPRFHFSSLAMKTRFNRNRLKT
jgi:hypothetical protein